MASPILVQPVDIITNSENIQTLTQTLSNVDLPLRYVMIGIGAFPANCVTLLPKRTRVILGVLQVFLTIFLFTTIIQATLSVWNSEGKDVTTNIYTIFFLEMSYTTPLDCLFFTVLGNLTHSFRDYYEHLTVVQHQMNKLRIPINLRLAISCVRTLLVLGVTIALSFAIPFVYDYIHHRWNLDPVFDSDNYNNNPTRAISGKIFHFISVAHVSLKLVYFYSVIINVALVIKSFNQKFALQVRERPDHVKMELSLYRHTHLELCKLVANINRLFRLLLATMICAYSTGILLIIYIVSRGVAKESEIREILIFWCVAFFLFLFMAILACQLIQDMVSIEDHHYT